MIVQSRPTLRIGNSKDAVTLGWSTNTATVLWSTNKAAYVLESSTNMSAPAAWTTVTNEPVTVNGENFVTNVLRDPIKFYRLRLEPQQQ